MERKRDLILAKIEGTYGTDPTPTAAANAIITQGDVSFEVVSSAKERNPALNYFGKIPPVQVGEALKLSFSVELKGSGAAGTAPRIGCLLKACGFGEAVVADTSVTYTPESDMECDSVTLYYYSGATLHKIKGCVGTVKLTAKTNEIMTLDFEFTGLYAGDHASDVIYPIPTYDSEQPIIFRGARLEYNNIDTLIIESLSVDVANTVSKQTDANADTGVARYFISQREAKGSFNPERVALATLNPWTIFENSTQANIAFGPVGSAGNQVSAVITGVTLDVPKYGSRENVIAWDLGFGINPTLTAGNNELVLSFT